MRLWGPYSAVGLAFAAATFGLDQANKWWMLGSFDIAAREPVSVTPFLKLVLVWNRGISYGWLAQHDNAGRWLLIGFSLTISVWLWLWLAKVRHPVNAGALGLMIGGALGNALDRVMHGAVADFYLFTLAGHEWYVFNIADVAIVAGVALLSYEMIFGGGESPGGQSRR